MSILSGDAHSQSKRHELIREFQDKRSVTAKRYEEATNQTKPTQAQGMLKRAKRQGIKADYLVADAWFGTKPMIQATQSLDITAILRMKKNKMKYTVVKKNGKVEEFDAKTLYQQAVKGEWKKVRNLPYYAVSMEVELEITEAEKSKPNRIKVRLLFVRGAACDSKASIGKKDWALFLTTATEMSPTKMLEIYALRWSIEVYFKEAKQHLGFLKEQTWTFASHTASIHLTAIRYLMLVYAKHENDDLRVCDIRSQMKDQLTTLDFAQRLWQLFRALISGTIEIFKKKLGKTTDIIMAAVDERVDQFFTEALQLDTFTIELEFK